MDVRSHQRQASLYGEALLTCPLCRPTSKAQPTQSPRSVVQVGSSSRLALDSPSRGDMQRVRFDSDKDPVCWRMQGCHKHFISMTGETYHIFKSQVERGNEDIEFQVMPCVGVKKSHLLPYVDLHLLVLQHKYSERKGSWMESVMGSRGSE